MQVGKSPRSGRGSLVVVYVVLGAWAGLVLPGCQETWPETGGEGVYDNTTDPTNNNAAYFGSQVCGACHQQINASHRVHAHASALLPVDNKAPSYPPQATRAGVPNPPSGTTWSEVAYLIGGHLRAGQFVDQQGFVMTNDAYGVDTKWKLAFPPTGTTAGFGPYEDQGNYSPANPQPYDYRCFKCHTTGGREQDPNNPQFQDNRPGLAGTWQEQGVQCEACHGPATDHVMDPATPDLYVDTRAEACGRCHTRATSGNVIQASGGYVEHNQQWPELRASGKHAQFQCIMCHDPHVSPNYARDQAIRNPCTHCHGQNMARHQGKVFTRGEYFELLGCESCHMPRASYSAAVAGAATVGAQGRAADIRTHIFRINTQPVGYQEMFTDDLSQVLTDAQGRAAVTVDFVCLRCHNGVGNAFHLSLQAAGPFAQNIHEEPG